MNLTEFTQLGNVVSAVCAVGAVTIAIFQFRKLNRKNDATIVLKLREMMRYYDEIDLNLRPDGKWTKQAEISAKEAQQLDRYMGLLEAAIAMVNNHQLDGRTFLSQHGYRLKNIKRSPVAQTRIKQSQDFWRTLTGYLDAEFEEADK